MLTRVPVLIWWFCLGNAVQPSDLRGRWADEAVKYDGLCRYGNSVNCCWGWRQTEWGHCRPNCQQGCKHGQCVAPDKCKCHPGYAGKSCNQDLNECGVKPRPCEHRCMNTHGSYKCFCLDGYTLNQDGTCRNARTCGHANCQYGCEVIKGVLQCTCPSPGLRLGPDSRTCVDIDECASRGGVCPRRRKCVNTFGSYFCKCHHGFKLMYINGRYTCIDKDTRPFCSLNPGSPKCRCKDGNCKALLRVSVEPHRPRTTTPAPRKSTTPSAGLTTRQTPRKSMTTTAQPVTLQTTSAPTTTTSMTTTTVTTASSSTPPGTTTSPPGTTTSPPETTASPPGTTTSPPGTTTSPPGTTTSPPETTASPPGTRTSPPETRTSPPGTTTSPPGTRTSPPGTTTSPPETRTSPPGTTTSPPETTTSPPGTTTSPPGTTASPPGTTTTAVSTTTTSVPTLSTTASSTTHNPTTLIVTTPLMTTANLATAALTTLIPTTASYTAVGTTTTITSIVGTTTTITSTAAPTSLTPPPATTRELTTTAFAKTTTLATTSSTPFATSTPPPPTTTLDNRINKEVTPRQRGDVHIPRQPGHNQVWEFDIELGNTAEARDDPAAGVLHCSFDHGVCDWMSDREGDLHWQTVQNPAGGQYLSVPQLKVGQRSIRGARLAVPLVPPWSRTDLCFSFSHWLTGHHVGVLQLFVKERGRSQRYGHALWSRTGGHGWRHTQVTLSRHTLEKVLLKADRRGQRGEIAIDDITLKRGSCT